MKTRLTFMPYAQAYVIVGNDDSARLVSYRTTVAVIDEDGWLYILGLYSPTTRRHIGAFMREYANSTYHTAKRLYEDGMRMNIYTGECEEYYKKKNFSPLP